MMEGRISFRSSYETDSHVRFLETSGNALSVAEAKVAIAKALGLERDFARKFDLKLVNVSDGNKSLDDDAELILPGASIVVQRTLWRPVDEVKHEAQSFVQQWVHGQETVGASSTRDGASGGTEINVNTKNPLPKRFLCAHCGNILENPMAVRCENSCSASVCKTCAEHLLEQSTPAVCPTCHKPAVKSFIPNRTLASIIAKTDFSAYEVPANNLLKAKTSIKKEDSSVSAADAASAGNANGGDTSAQVASDSPGYLFFVRPEQIQTVHSQGILILPSNVEELNKDATTSQSPLTAYVFALGGGGTSLITPGTAKIKHIIYVGEARLDQRKPNACTQITEELDPARLAPPLASIVTSWFEALPEKPSTYILCRLEWEVKFQSVLLLPGKAQPIAGIRAGCAQSRGKYGNGVEVIKLSQSQKQGVAGRLSQEALFARMNSRLTPQTQQQDVARPATSSLTQDVMQCDSNSSVTPGPSSSVAVSGNYVFDASANAWMTVERLNKKRHEQSASSTAAEGEKNNQWQIASQLRACFGSNSIFTTMQSPDSVTHWSLVNPLLPYISQLPKLSEQSFRVIQALQMLALKRLVATKQITPDLLEGLNEFTGQVEDAVPRKSASSAPNKQVDTPRPSLPPAVAPHNPQLPFTSNVSSQASRPIPVETQNKRVEPSMTFVVPQRSAPTNTRILPTIYPTARPSMSEMPSSSHPPALVAQRRPYPPNGITQQYYTPWVATQQPQYTPMPPVLVPHPQYNSAMQGQSMPIQQQLMPMQQQGPSLQQPPMQPIAVQQPPISMQQPPYMFMVERQPLMNAPVPDQSMRQQTPAIGRMYDQHHHPSLPLAPSQYHVSRTLVPSNTDMYTGVPRGHQHHHPHPQSSRARMPYHQTYGSNRHQSWEDTSSFHNVDTSDFYSGKQTMRNTSSNNSTNKNVTNTGTRGVTSSVRSSDKSSPPAAEPVAPTHKTSNQDHTVNRRDDRKQELLSKSLSSFHQQRRRGSKSEAVRRRSPDTKGADPPPKRRRHHDAVEGGESTAANHHRYAREQPPNRSVVQNTMAPLQRASPPAHRKPSPILQSRRRRASIEKRSREPDAREAAARLFNASLPSQSHFDGQRPKRFDTHRRRISQPPMEDSHTPLRQPSSKSEQSSLVTTSTRKRPKNSLFT